MQLLVLSPATFSGSFRTTAGTDARSGTDVSSFPPERTHATQQRQQDKGVQSDPAPSPAVPGGRGPPPSRCRPVLQVHPQLKPASGNQGFPATTIARITSEQWQEKPIEDIFCCNFAGMLIILKLL